MKFKIGLENKDAEQKLAADFVDNSGIGVHYMDAYLTRIIHSANKSRNIFFKILKYRNVKKHHNCFRLIL